MTIQIYTKILFYKITFQKELSLHCEGYQTFTLSIAVGFEFVVNLNSLFAGLTQIFTSEEKVNLSGVGIKASKLVGSF